MALTGTYTRSLDEKRRLAIPKRLREGFSAEELQCLYVAPGTERSLSLYSPEGFERLANRLSEKSMNRGEIRNYLRLFYSRAEQVDLDSQGRIRIPDRLAEFAQLEGETMLLGVHDHAEIWNRSHWESFLEEHSSDFDEMAARAFE